MGVYISLVLHKHSFPPYCVYQQWNYGTFTCNLRFAVFYKLLFDKYGRSKAGIACADPEFFLKKGGGVRRLVEFAGGGGGLRYIFGNFVV